MISISQLAQHSAAARYIVDTVQATGSLKVMLQGDSLVAGAGDNTSALRLPWLTLLILLGIPVQTVGDITGTAAGDRYLFNTLGFGGTNGVDLLYQAQGSKTTSDFIAGTNTLRKLSVALADFKPHMVLSCLGTNDPSPGVQATYDNYIKTVFDYNNNCLLSITGPPDSNDTTKAYYDVDVQRADIKTAIKAACRSTSPGNAYFADSAASLGVWTRYPTTDYTTDHLNANAVFYDSTHLKPEGSAMIAVGQFASLFGVSIAEMMALMQSAGPFAPTQWAYGADVASTTADMIVSGPRKLTLDELTVYNTDASTTATVTVGRKRLSQDGSSTSASTAWRAIKVPAGATIGFSIHKDIPPVAHYNEGWYVTTTTTCNIRAFGRRILA